MIICGCKWKWLTLDTELLNERDEKLSLVALLRKAEAGLLLSGSFLDVELLL